MVKDHCLQIISRLLLLFVTTKIYGLGRNTNSLHFDVYNMLCYLSLIESFVLWIFYMYLDIGGLVERPLFLHLFISFVLDKVDRFIYSFDAFIVFVPKSKHIFSLLKLL